MDAQSACVVDRFLPPDVEFIRREKHDSYFLSRRLHTDENREGDDAYHDDNAGLQDIVLFLKDIRATVSSIHVV